MAAGMRLNTTFVSFKCLVEFKLARQNLNLTFYSYIHTTIFVFSNLTESKYLLVRIRMMNKMSTSQR